MNMNMCIIMTMNIYITASNEEQLRKVKDSTMSGLINYLLDKHFGHHSGDELAPGAKGGVVLRDLPPPTVAKEQLYPELKKPPIRLADSEEAKLTETNSAVFRNIVRVNAQAEDWENKNAKAAHGICKIHGTPLDTRGRCLQKGCKYA